MARDEWQAEAKDSQSKLAVLKEEAAKLGREVDRLVNALAKTDGKPDAIVKGIADRQGRLRDVDGQLRAAEAAPAFIEHHLDRIARRARAAIENMRKTFEHQPEQARELVGVLFDGKIVFRPIDTPGGPRFELEGLAAPGRLLAVEGAAGVLKGASPAGVESEDSVLSTRPHVDSREVDPPPVGVSARPVVDVGPSNTPAPVDADDALRLAIKAAVDVGDYERAGMLVEVAKRTTKKLASVTVLDVVRDEHERQR